MQNIVKLHRRATETARTAVAAVRPADLDRPTPCAGWDLRTLLEHMTGQDRGFAAVARSAEDVPADAFAPHPLGDDPVTTLAAGSAEVVAAFAAADLDRSVLLAEFGTRFPLSVVVSFHLIDTLIHGWDVAATLGADITYADELVAAGLTVAKQVPEGAAREAPGAPFGPVVPVAEAAGPWEQTLALLGRDPAWRAPAWTS